MTLRGIFGNYVKKKENIDASRHFWQLCQKITLTLLGISANYVKENIDTSGHFWQLCTNKNKIETSGHFDNYVKEKNNCRWIKIDKMCNFRKFCIFTFGAFHKQPILYRISKLCLPISILMWSLGPQSLTLADEIIKLEILLLNIEKPQKNFSQFMFASVSIRVPN